MRFCAQNPLFTAQKTGKLLALLLIAPVFSFCGPAEEPEDDQADKSRLDFIRSADPYRAVDHDCVTSQEEQVVSIINDLRSRSGAREVRCLPELNKMASSHASYLVYNDVRGASGHDEISGRPGYTGANLTSRAQSAGIDPNSFWIAEGISWNPGTEREAIIRHVRSVYHRSQFMTPGSKYLTYVTKSGEVPIGVFNSLAWVDITGLAPIVFPPHDADNVPIDFDNEREIPNPMHGYTRVGYPISVHFPRYLKKETEKEPRLVVKRFKLFEIENGSQKRVSVKIIKPSTDATLFGGDAFIVPYKPLKKNTTYTVDANVTYGGFHLERIWSFRTGSM